MDGDSWENKPNWDRIKKESEAVKQHRTKLEALHVRLGGLKETLVKLQDEKSSYLQERGKLVEKLVDANKEIETWKASFSKLKEDNQKVKNMYDQDKKLLSTLYKDTEETKNFIYAEVQSLKEQKDLVAIEQKNLLEQKYSPLRIPLWLNELWETKKWDKRTQGRAEWADLCQGNDSARVHGKPKVPIVGLFFAVLSGSKHRDAFQVQRHLGKHERRVRELIKE